MQETNDNGGSEITIPTGLARLLSGFDETGRGGASPFEGLLLSANETSFRISVTGLPGAPDLVLGPYDDEDVSQVWQALAASSRLPLMYRDTFGVPVELGSPAARATRPASDRRRLAVLNGRRPRFLARRKTGRFSQRTSVHRERELAAGRD